MSEKPKVIAVDEGEALPGAAVPPSPIEQEPEKTKRKPRAKKAAANPSVKLEAEGDAVVVVVEHAEVLRKAGYEVLDRYEFPLEDPEATVKAHRVMGKVREAIAGLKPPASGGKRSTSDLTHFIVEAGQARANTFIYGPTGSGKTRAVLEGMAALVKLGELDVYYKVPMSPGVEDVDLVTRIIPGKSGLEERAGALRAIFNEAREQRVGLLIDEVNRATARALNILLTAVDPVEGRYVLYDFVTDEEVEVPLENLFVVATANLGGSYSGTNTLDEALVDRFPRTIFWGYDTKLEKKLVKGAGAKNLHKVAAVLRDLYRSGELKSPFSTRHLIGWASMLNSFEDASAAVEAARKTFVYRIASVDSYGFPDEAEVELIVEAIKDAFGGEGGQG